MMKAYPEYKDSAVKWAGEIPAHWDVSKIKFSTDCLDGKRIPLNAEQRGEMSGEYPYWGANGIVDYVNDYLFDEDIVLVGEDGAPFFDKKKDVAFTVKEKVWVNNHAHILRSKKHKINDDFLKHILNTVSYELYINGSTRDKLTQFELNNIHLPLPDVSEQERIVSFLNVETNRIDNLIAEKENFIKLLSEKRQALISHVVTKGLNPNVPMKDSGVEWIGEIPEHWITRRLKHISPKIGVGLVINPSTYTRDEGVHYIFGGDVKEFHIDLSSTRKMSPEDSEMLTSSRLSEGDLISVRVGYPGMTAVVSKELEGANCASVVVIRKGEFDSGWLCACMNSDVGKEQVDLAVYGAAMKQYNVSDAIEFVFPVPPKEEQEQISRYINIQRDKLHQLENETNKSIDLLKEHRTALISAAVTGKIDVREEA